MTTPPAKTLGGTPARSGSDAERSFGYFQPAGRRATLYEDVTVDTQPSPHRHLKWGWYVHFEDGRGTWSDRTTRVKCGDWFAFRDPGEIWERPYYQDGTAYEREIESTLQTARRDGLFASFSPEWVAFLRANVQIPAFMEHGLWLAEAINARDCLSDTIATVDALHAAMKQRQAQALVLYGMDLETEFGDFPVETARTAWLGDEAWQPTRSYVERLRTTTDWMETIVAANVCFEPLVGELVRRELLIRGAIENHDVVTPGVLRGAQHESGWAEVWTAELLRFVAADEEHGAANAAVVQEWIAEWLPLARDAAAALAPVFAALPAGPDHATAVANAERGLAAMLEPIDALSVPEAVTA